MSRAETAYPYRRTKSTPLSELFRIVRDGVDAWSDSKCAWDRIGVLAALAEIEGRGRGGSDDGSDGETDNAA